jgi:hypothetical protein
MGRKIRAAKASLVAAFLAAGGTAAATTGHAASKGTVNWGDPLIRVLKLDGFPDYLKAVDSAQLALFYKPQLIEDAGQLYDKWSPQVAGLLDLYQKADAGPLDGILVGLEQFYKEHNSAPLLDYIKDKTGLENYQKWEAFFGALQAVDPNAEGALGFFQKDTGILGDPLAVPSDDGQVS